MKARIRNLEINYEILGEGKPLLVLHGWGSEARKWIKTAEYLAEDFKVIILDLPGFGSSQKPHFIWGLDEYSSFLKDFIDYLELEDFFLLGHSFGGSLAAKYALRHPVKKLILVDAACIRKKTFKKSFLRFCSKSFESIKNISWIRKNLYRIVKSDYPASEGIMKEIYLKVIKQDLSKDLEKIRIPVLIIWGEKDKITPLSQAKIIQDKIKGSELRIIEGADHSPHLSCPEKLSEIIKAP